MLARIIEREVENGLKAAIRPAMRYLRGVSLGMLFLGIAGALAVVSVIGFGLAVFFALVPSLGYAGAALALTGTGLVLSFIAIFLGLQNLRLPSED